MAIGNKSGGNHLQMWISGLFKKSENCTVGAHARRGWLGLGPGSLGWTSLCSVVDCGPTAGLSVLVPGCYLALGGT